ncbi:MAG: nucleoside hydrolase [Kiritimatiellia bacterium]
MKNTVKSLVTASFVLVGAVLCADVPKIIFDTDMYTDFDDVGALAVLHTLADAGECEILGTVVSTRKSPSSGMVELINAYYGRGELPIGAPRGLGLGPDVDPGALKNPSYKIYAELVAAHRELKFPTSDLVPDANEVYRRLLAAAPDASVTIVTVGFTTNLRRLLETKADAVSPLDGKALVARKVKAWYAMACKFPDGFEYNSGADGASSKIAFAEWPTPVYFLDYVYGVEVKCGVPVSRLADAVNPVRDVFKRALADYKEAASGHPSWDEVTVLAAVRGWRPHFGAERGRFEIVDAKGRNHWTRDEKGSHFVLTVKTPKAEVGRIVDELMARGAKARK